MRLLSHTSTVAETNTQFAGSVATLAQIRFKTMKMISTICKNVKVGCVNAENHQFLAIHVATAQIVAQGKPVLIVHMISLG